MTAVRTAFVFSLGLLSAAALAASAQSAAQSSAQSAAQSTAQSPEQSAAQGVEAPAAELAPAQVFVSAKRPGPGLWKVSKDGHVMWVFALYSPLPRAMEWDTARVERLVAQSQEVLLRPGASVGVGWLGGLGMLPALIGLQKNPDGASLREILPADLYGRWSVLKQKYIGDDDDVEHLRPYFAAEKLTAAGLYTHGLAKGDVEGRIAKIAKQRDVKLTSTGVSVTLENPRAAIKEFKNSQMEDSTCFRKTLDTFEGDIDAMKLRADAWANGNIAAISKLDYTEREDACNDAMLNGSFARNNPAFQNLREKGRAAWFKAAERALATNASTFAMLPIAQVIGPRSYLAELQAKGYAVESPK